MLKAAQEKERAEREKEKKMLDEFRVKTGEQIRAFLGNEEQKWMKYPPQNKILRGIIHECSGEAGLVSHSFGSEEEKFVMVYKKESAPSEEELEKMHLKFDLNMTEEEIEKEKKVKQEEEKRRQERLELEKEYTLKQKMLKKQNKKKKGEAPEDIEADLIVLCNTKKRDRRTIEEIQEDLRKTKKKDTSIANFQEPVVLQSSNVGDK